MPQTTVTCALAALAILSMSALAQDSRSAPPRSFRAVRDDFVREFLRRHPVPCTYLGGEGLDPSLAEVNGRLRDWSAGALAEECGRFRGFLAEIDALDGARLDPDEGIDCEVMRAQLAFMIRLVEVRRHHLRAVESYTTEAARGVDWAIQGMTARAGGGLGTEAEWQAVVRRVEAIPESLRIAARNLAAGAAAGVLADSRMIERDGIAAADANAVYFAATLPREARNHLGAAPFAAAVNEGLGRAGAAAERAFRDYAAALAALPRRETFPMGEEEYAWALRNNLRVATPPRRLFEASAGDVRRTQELMFAVAERIARKRGLDLPFGTEEERFASVRAVMDRLGADHPRDDRELLAWCRERSDALVDFARSHRMFALPETYRLDIVETPPQLRSAIEAAYYPAPPFKKTGVGRFYVTPTGGDAGLLREFNRHALTDLCAHEGFPGHDWHYQYMSSRSASISPVRWLTPGAVEDTCSMWEDSMAAEGWALYAEEIMAEPRDGAPEGFYTPEERLYQLNWQLVRDVRVRVDTGIHIGALTYDEAVDWFARNVSFVPDARKRPDDATARTALAVADRAIYRYSKWPTQAITYQLGKKAILELRAACARVAGPKFSTRRFHELFMEQGTIPAGCFRDRLLSRAPEMIE